MAVGSEAASDYLVGGTSEKNVSGENRLRPWNAVKAGACFRCEKPQAADLLCTKQFRVSHDC